MRDSQGEPDVAPEPVVAPAQVPASPPAPESGATAEASEVSAESEATAQLAAAESAQASARSAAKTSAQTSALDVSGTAATERASARTSKRFVLPDDRREGGWWVRHAGQIQRAEWVLIALFLAAAGYFLCLWFWPSTATQEPAAVPTRADFRSALMALPPVTPAASWRVAAAPGRWRLIVVHHTATVRGDPVAIDRYHRENNKWENGLGYHFLIGNGHGMPDGAVFVGGRWTRQLDGAHVRAAGDGNGGANANSFAIGIALVGNFQSALPTPAQLAALRGLLAFLMREYAIPASGLLGHGELSARPTAGPGEYFYMEEVKRALEAN